MIFRKYDINFGEVREHFRILFHLLNLDVPYSLLIFSSRANIDDKYKIIVLNWNIFVIRDVSTEIFVNFVEEIH